MTRQRFPQLALAGAVMAVVACMSAGGVGRRAVYTGTRYEVCIAAQAAVKDLGGRVITANCETGTIVGRLDAEGTAVRLDVSMDQNPTAGRSATAGAPPIDLAVHASLIGMDEPGKRWLDQLGRIVDHYLELVRQRLGHR
jgi:hypothetical protein